METETNIKSFPVKRTYSSLEVDLIDKVVIPLLRLSIQYDRGVGFFTSGWLKEASRGLISFVKNNGKARIITSPHLTEDDWKVISKAEKEHREQLIVATSLKKTLTELERNLEWDTLAALAWLIRDGVLEFRFAVPQSNLSGGIFHSKLSIFTDIEGNSIALHGSQNDSLQASLNEESFSLFCSWDDGAQWHEEHRKRFNRMWDNEFENLRILKINEAEKEIIICYAEKLPRPYPSIIGDASNVAGSTGKEPCPNPSITLHGYQNQAIAEWEKQGRRGIFEMATGTGKTITAISAAVDIYKAEGRLAVIVLVPYKHLVDQWIVELKDFGFKPTGCYESVNVWKKSTASQIREFNAGLMKHLCLVSTHHTASMESFQKMLKRIQGPFLLIGDEIHELGATNRKKALCENAPWRIGLSATPDRWYDEEGTDILRNYFGNTIIKYELKQAIKEKALTPYLYYPVKVDLTEEEIEEYVRLSKLISQFRDEDDSRTKLESLLRKRADLLGKASGKIPRLIKMVNQHKQECEAKGEKFQHVLFYCNKGTHKLVLRELNKTGLRVHEFVHDVPLKERQKVLSAFSNGEIDGLVAIKCLDQGVDVPATQRAYILASSTNPREYVQRRGRILRKYSGKQLALVYDFLVGPWNTSERLGRGISKSILLRELPRFAEFSLDAINSQEGRNAIKETVEKLDLLPAWRKRPWEVYKELQSQIR